MSIRLTLCRRAVLQGLLCLGLLEAAQGENPIVVGQGLTDPAPRVYNNRVYLYATHDASPDSQNFTMNDWWVWSSEDLVNWKHESTLRPEDTYWGKPSTSCWATDGISSHGRYYFYFSRGADEIGVVEGNTPAGPWSDTLHKPLVAAGSTPTAARDPAIFQKADGTTYAVFGCWNYYIAKLNPDLVTLAETPRELQLDQKMGPYGPGKTDDKPYLHFYNGKYYLSWGCFYAMSDDVYGPYRYKGCIITEKTTAPEFQRGLVHDRHGGFFEFHHQWYFACNDKSWPGTSEYFRDTIVSYVHYRDDGTIAPVRIDRTGVGQYNAQQPIEAEDYYSADGVVVKESPPAAGGFELRGIHNGSHVEYPKVMNLPPRATISFRYAAEVGGATTVEVRESTPLGGLLGTCQLPGTDGWAKYGTASTALRNAEGTQNVCLVFRGEAGKELARLDQFSFTAPDR